MSLVSLVLHSNGSLRTLRTDLFVSLWMVHTPKIFCFSMDYSGVSYWSSGFCILHAYCWSHYPPRPTYHADDIQIYLPVDPAVPGGVVCGMFKISRCVEDINSWMIRNKLKLNPDKTEFFIMSSSYHRTVLHDLSLHIVGDIIPQSSTVRNLGVVFDQQMNMDQHITKPSIGKYNPQPVQDPQVY